VGDVNDGDGRRREMERALARLSAEEIVSALKLDGAPMAIRAAVRTAFVAVSAPLGRVLARFDSRIAERGICNAAAGALTDFGVQWERSGPRPPMRGPLLVVSNHPGAYDALALFAATGRDDIRVVASDRAFLRAMPYLRRHLILVPESLTTPSIARARGLREAMSALRAGGTLLHFGAGRIEPDPAFIASTGTERLAPWLTGTGRLVRAVASAGGSIVVAMAEGVHSRRAKDLWLTRLAERHGMTTLAPLLQVAIPLYREVNAVVRFGDAVPARELTMDRTDAEVTEVVRGMALGLGLQGNERRTASGTV
jgi:1-acyl-sn-glycerol-3-phosphate acyltransferase